MPFNDDKNTIVENQKRKKASYGNPNSQNSSQNTNSNTQSNFKPNTRFVKIAECKECTDDAADEDTVPYLQQCAQQCTFY